MANQNLQTLKGFRDFLPEEKRKRDYLEKKIVETFEKYAFEPLETPTLEYASLLKGKYGEEADQLLYTFKDRGGREIGLRYDQTVPSARVLAQYRNNLPKFFRRYQIQNNYRSEKPQSGRYREFKQADADIFGTDSPLADAEIISLYYKIYEDIGFTTLKIKVNDRKTLIDTLGKYEKKGVSVFSIIQSIDKIDKVKEEGVIKELVEKGMPEKEAKKALEDIQKASPSDNLKLIMQYVKSLGVPAKSLEFSPTLARGLDYYTGMIFEGEVEGYDSGSVGGGGRYNNLINELSGVKIEAVGFGLGFDRTLEAAEKMGILPEDNPSAEVLITVFEDQINSSLKVAAALRKSGIKTEIYPDSKDNLGKQLSLANKKNIPFCIVLGEEEQKSGKVSLKDMNSGKQEKLDLSQFIEKIKTS